MIWLATFWFLGWLTSCVLIILAWKTGLGPAEYLINCLLLIVIWPWNLYCIGRGWITSRRR